MKRTIRLILDKARPAAANMALDDALLEARLADPASLPTLRFYSWSEPCCTVGYFQSVAAASRALGGKTPVARRPTGGGLVVHGDDLTFSISLPAANPFLGEDVKASYLKVNMALLKGLRPLFPSIDFSPCKDEPSGRASDSRVCFESPSCYDLMLGKKKAVGASQRRRGGAILHQSTVFLEGDKDALIAAIRKGFEEEWKAELEKSAWTEKELEAAAKLAEERWGTAEWASPAVQDARAAFFDSSFER